MGSWLSKEGGKMIENLTNITYKAGGYLRLSQEDDNTQNESSSITNQKAIIQEFAKNNGIEIYDFYVDDGYSGGNFDRPGFKRMINDIECGIINCVITKDTSRLGREFIETGTYMFKYFPEHDIRYIAITDNYDTLKPNGVEDFIPFKAVFNDMYLKDISRKVKSTRHELMKKGLFVGSTVTYGFKRSEEDSRKFEIDEYAARIVLRIFNMKKDGMSSPMIARTLTNEGILPPDVYRNKKPTKKTITKNIWKSCSVNYILKNEAYVGTLIQNKYERVSLKSKKKRLLPKSQWIVRKNALPRIVPQELFDAVNVPTPKTGIRHCEYDYLLKGLVKCADCGATMTVRRVKNSTDKSVITPVYLCRNYVRYRNGVCSMHYMREDTINEVVQNDVKAVLAKYSNDDKLKKKYENTMSKSSVLDDNENQLKDYSEQLVNIDKALSDLYKDKASGIITGEEFNSIKKELEVERETVKSQIEHIKNTIAKMKNNLTDDKTKQQFINEFLKEDKPNKEVFKTLINRIEVFEDKTIKIHYNFNINEV